VNDLHPGDEILNRVLKRISALYGVSQIECAKILGYFLGGKIKELQVLKGEKPSEYQRRVMRMFQGVKWRMIRRKIAILLTNVDIEAADLINDALEEAFAAGFNESAYALALTGIEMWPITVPIVGKLTAEGVIKLNKRTLKKRKATVYNEERAQSAVYSAIIRGIDPEKLRTQLAYSIAHARQNETIASARAIIYGASDTGAYYAGREAERMGIDVEKTWLSIMDMRVRPSHKHLHGVTIPLDEKFKGYHGDLRYPHDPLAPPAEIYNCRCRMAVHAAGKSPGEYSRSLLPTQTAAYKEWRDAQIRAAGSELELMKLHRRR